MPRYVSKILIFLAFSHAVLPGLASSNVAAQELQQPQTSDTVAVAPDQRPHLQIPEGTHIEIEAPYTFRSIDFKPNDKISFRVVHPVKIDGVTVIEQGATATGRIDKAKRGGHFGKAGLFVWTMQTVTAVDGSQVLSVPFLCD